MLESSLESEYIENAPFGLTETAAAKISKLLVDEGEPQNAFMRVAVEGGGCSGFQYTFKFDTQKNDDDLVFAKNGIEVVVDKVSLELLHGGARDA